MRSVLILGFLLGMRHALEADHLAAVASMSAGTRDRFSVMLRGATWGAGHTVALLAAGALSFAFGVAIPAGAWAERAVGVMLVILGVSVLIRLRRQRVHVHVHRHDDGIVHLHAHQHASEDRHAADHRHAHRKLDVKAALVGMMHGLAGSAAILLIVASTMRSRWLALAYIAVFGVGSILGMAAFSAVIAVPLQLSARRLARAYVALELLIAMGTIALGVSMALADLRAAAPDDWPTRAWTTSSPEALGFTPGALEALDQELGSGRYGYIDGMLVIRHGRIALERAYTHDYKALFVGRGAPGIYNYFDPAWHPFYKGTGLHTMQSVSKSVTSALIGMAIASGKIPGVDVNVMPYFSDFRIAPDPRRDRMTLRDVLTMTTGIQWDESSTSYTDAKNNCAEMEARDDWIQYVLDQPMAADPGAIFVYNSGATELLSYIIRKTTGQAADDYARQHLFEPLGIEYFWKRTPKGLADTEGGLYLRPTDLAKIGYLYLKNGIWEGKQILPSEWVTDSIRWHVDAGKTGRGYGYKWWVLSRKGPDNPAGYDAYAALGYGGQRLIVIPELDLIAVFTGWNIYDKPELNPKFALDRVVDAVRAR